MILRTFMDLRVTFLLLLAVAFVAQSSAGNIGSHWTLTAFPASIQKDDGAQLLGMCDGSIGECLGEDEEMMLDSELNRRGLAARKRYISYGALQRNRVPCNRRGHSYYNCKKRGRAHPYSRGCSVITRCARQLR